MAVQQPERTAHNRKPRKVIRHASFDPEQHRERVRGVITVVLLVQLGGAMTWILVLVSLGLIDTPTLSALLTGVLTPLLTAAGVGTGFYFGSQSSRPNP